MAREKQFDPIEELKEILASDSGQIEERKREALLGALPERCRTECTIARMVIDRVIKQGITGNWVLENLGECPGEPSVTGECSEKKTICSHPEAGNTDNFSAQVNNLYNYIQS